MTRTRRGWTPEPCADAAADRTVRAARAEVKRHNIGDELIPKEGRHTRGFNIDPLMTAGPAREVGVDKISCKLPTSEPMKRQRETRRANLAGGP